MGFIRKHWVLGKLRHIDIIKYFKKASNDMVSLEDLERFKKDCRVDLSSIERTYELNTLPSDPYLAMSRIVEVFGTHNFELFAQGLPKAATYKDAMALVTTVYSISEYTGKNILAFFALAECKYPWVPTAFSAEENFVAIGPNPAVLANVCHGADLNTTTSTQVTKATQDTFMEIMQETRGFLPTSFKAKFKSGKVVEAREPDKCRSGHAPGSDASRIEAPRANSKIKTIAYTGRD